MAKELSKEERLELRRQRITAIFALLVLIPILALLYLAFNPTEGPPSFTRIGGHSRIETAVEVSEFWPATTDTILVRPHRGGLKEILDAGLRAAADDSPLLLTPLTKRAPAAVQKTLSKRQKACVVLIGESSETTQMPRALQKRADSCKGQSTSLQGKPPPISMITFGTPSPLGDISHSELLKEYDVRLMRQSGKECALPETTIFATVQHDPDLPDVAVAIALASHLARNQDFGHVGIIVLPRYLQIESDLQELVRECGSTVTEAFIIGGTDAVSGDLRDLLKVTVVPSNIEKQVAALKDTAAQVGQIVLAVALIFGILYGGKKGYNIVKEEKARSGGRLSWLQLPRLLWKRARQRGVMKVSSRDSLEMAIRRAIPDNRGGYIRLHLKSPPRWIAGIWASVEDKRKSFASTSFIYLFATIQCNPDTGEILLTHDGKVMRLRQAALIPMEEIQLIEVIAD
jgi:hypothetical protein